MNHSPTFAETVRAAVADEGQLRQALASADIIPALMVLVHLTNDTSLLQAASPYIAGAWNYQESIPQDIRTRIREGLVQALKAQALDPVGPAAVSPQELRQRMSASVGSEIPQEYVPLFLEELGLASGEGRSLQWRQPLNAGQLENFKVVIVGAGLSGICAAIRLKEAGVPFVILERSTEVGGTWHENIYPGCGVDTPVHFYSFSFHPNPEWSRHFALRDEIQQYILGTVERYGLRSDIRFGCEVQRAKYDELAAAWRVTVADRSGHVQELVCNALVTAAGHNVPATPRITGIESFQGPVVHTARWDPEVDLTGKRVAMIGTGASGMQAGPALLPRLSALTVFQRTPHWAMGNPNYHKEVSEGQKWALRHIPYFQSWSRFLIFWAASDAFHAMLHMDPAWPLPEQSLNEENHRLRLSIIEYMRKELGGDEDLLRKCTPGYPPYGKRLLRDNHWFKMLRDPKVSLVVDPIARVEAGAIVTEDGTRHDVDAIVMATGFHASKLLWPMEIVGRHGQSIREVWGDDDPRAYKGMTVPGFPNLFLLAGPNTILSHGGSAIFHSECQVTYILQAIREMVEGGVRELEVRHDVYCAYNRLVDDKLRAMVWSHPGVNSWYKNAKGRVTMTSPWRLVDFWNLTRTFELGDFNVSLDAEAAQAGLPSEGGQCVEQAAR